MKGCDHHPVSFGDWKQECKGFLAITAKNRVSPEPAEFTVCVVRRAKPCRYLLRWSKLSDVERLHRLIEEDRLIDGVLCDELDKTCILNRKSLVR